MIYTDRFYLRKFRKSDAQAMFNNWASDSEVTKFLTWNTHSDISVTNAYIDYLINGKCSDYAICVKETDEVIGSIANVKENADYTVCELGYCLSRKYWNQGVMTEVLDAYLDDLFINKNYQVVEAEHMIENAASGAVMIKCGFRFNYNTDLLCDKHGWISVKHYSITKEEYLMHKLQQKLNQFLNSKVPLFYNLHQTITYLNNQGYLIKIINCIDNPMIKYHDSKDVIVIKKSEFNINKYYLIGKSTKKEVFNKYVNNFIDNNNNYIISIGNISIEEVLVKLLNDNNLTISFSESCTGGLMASTIINVSGASNIIKESYVTYSDEVKTKVLGVKETTLEEFSVYSKEVAYEMANGLYGLTKSNICVSITGLAGGNNYNPGDGSFFSCILINFNNKFEKIELFKKVKGTRNEVRKKQVNEVFYQIIKALKSIL